MECSICLEPLNQNDRRPKVLGCGHSYCQQCLERLPQKKCPVDRKAFAGAVAELVDNFYLLQLTPAAPRFWCTSCKKEASPKCAEAGHPMGSLKKVRAAESAMEALQQTEDTLAAALRTVDTAKETLVREQERLRATRARLQAARGADVETWANALRGVNVDAQDWKERDNGSLPPWPRSGAVYVGLRVRSANKLGIVTADWVRRRDFDPEPPRVRYDSGGSQQTSDFSVVLEPWELKSGSTPRAVDLLETSSNSNIQDKVNVLAGPVLNEALTLVGLNCRNAATWCEQVLLKVPLQLESLQLLYPEQRHVVAALAMPRLHSLALVGVTKELLQQVVKKTTLRRLELHCTFAASLPAPLPTFTRMGLRWLRCGLYPLRVALALAAANADTLEELQLVADTDKPHGCPDLAKEIQRCDLKALKRMVLLRENAFGSSCEHSVKSCTLQKLQLWDMFGAACAVVEVICYRCDFSTTALI